MKKRKKVIQGGTSSGKTYGIIPILIDKAAKIPKLKITVVCETIPAAKDGPVDIFKGVMQDTGRWREEGWIGSPMEYTFANGSKIQFKAFDTEGKAKAAGKRDILFINEGNHIPFKIADALMVRSKEIWIDFNPDAEFWAHTEVLIEPSSELLILTYEDNEALPAETLEDLYFKMDKAFYDPQGDWDDSKNIKSEYWANWCRVYIKGQIGNLEGQVLQNWKILDNLPPEARYTASGMDFGYTQDPSTLIDRYEWNGKRVYDEVLYQKGLLNSDLAKAAKQPIPDRTGQSRLIYADSAEPKSIAEIKKHGVKIYPTEKGKDSINFGIQLLQEDEFYVTARSLNMIKELRKYLWDKDKNGQKTGKPIDGWNHTIDPMRYIEMKLRLKPKRTTRIRV
ncbi:PBSX family phage terminase large subunit [Salinimicrobium sediminis]|uniref:PBSX family phage terminase large subunit n=1 Tax=Salinimicrobium sediminis TaxID=1343891 RepID=UPI0015CB0490|nr:terminase large subunit [Salinimicrobium sediminis]